MVSVPARGTIGVVCIYKCILLTHHFLPLQPLLLPLRSLFSLHLLSAQLVLVLLTVVIVESASRGVDLNIVTSVVNAIFLLYVYVDQYPR